MASELFQCDVLTPEGRVFSGKISQAVFPAHDGLMGVLVGHAPMVCELGYGVLRVWTDSRQQEGLFIEGGIAQVVPDRLVILTQSAVGLDRVTRAEAMKLLEEAQEIKPTDEVTARRKAELNANAQARLRICVR